MKLEIILVSDMKLSKDWAKDHSGRSISALTTRINAMWQ